MTLRATVRHLAAAGLVLAVVAPALAAGRAFEIADYYRTAFVESPALAPDGAAVVFAVRRYALEEGESWSEIWMTKVDGGGLRQMTFGRHHDSSPVFSADGRRIVFVSDRSGDSQLWVMAVDGGGARQLTRFPTGVEGPVVSPDGRFIAVLSQVYPECGADAECNRTTQEAIDGGPLKVHLADALLYRHWTEWRDGRFRHVLLVDAASGEVAADLTPGRWDSPTFSLGGPSGYAFSPDGRQLCVVSDHSEVPALSTNSDLWLVDIDDNGRPGAPRDITAANPGWDGDPTFSPDGRFIAFRSQATPGYESALFRLALYDRTAGTVRYLTDRERFDNWVEAVGWGGAKLFFQGAVKGYNPIFTIDLASGAISQVLQDGTIDAWQAAPDGATIVYARRAVDRPQELARLRIAAGAPERITWFNRDLETEVDLRPVEEMWVEGDGGRPVQVFIVKPHGFDASRRYPLIFNVHGGPQSQWADSYRGDWQVYPGKGYVVAFANPTGSTGNGQEVTDGIACDWGGRVWRDLMKVTDALAKLPYVDADRMGAMGWSWGGYAMMWAEGHTTRFKALASMMGVYDLRSMHGGTEELWFPEHDMCGTPWTSDDYERWSPSRSVKHFATPCLVITGEKDFRVPYTQSLQFFTDLQRMKVPSRLVVFPDAGHWPSWYEMAFYYDVHLDWFHQWLGGEPAPWPVESFARNQVFTSGSGD